MDPITVYAFSYADGAFEGPVELGQDDRGPAGEVLIPGNCTAIAPLAAPPGMAAAFAGGSWSLRPDHRGQTWYRQDGSAVVVVQLGDPLLAGLTDARPPRVYTADDCRNECARRIEAYASQATQRNLAGYFALLGVKSAALNEAEANEVRAFALGLNWIGVMRQKWRDLAAAGADPTVDANWPAAPPEAVALAARF